MLYVLHYSIRAGMRLSRVKNGCVMSASSPRRSPGPSVFAFEVAPKSHQAPAFAGATEKDRSSRVAALHGCWGYFLLTRKAKSPSANFARSGVSTAMFCADRSTLPCSSNKIA